MTVFTVFLQDEIDEARANEKLRLAEIMTSPLTKGRRKLAMVLAFETYLPARIALLILANAPRGLGAVSSPIVRAFTAKQERPPYCAVVQPIVSDIDDLEGCAKPPSSIQKRMH